MPLPAPNLDDRKFQDIVDEAKRLIPRYCPEWTNHNLSDPGVALIELFAWMSEMVLFRVNQVPDRLYVHFLNMVGIEPFPPSVARVDLTFWLSAVLEQPVVVPEGTEVMTAADASSGTDEAVVFSTLEDLVIAPPELISAKNVTATDERITDVWDDLRFSVEGVQCFPSPGITPGDTFCLGFAKTLAGELIRLTVTAEAEGIGVDPKNPPLVWEVWSGEAWITVTVHDDTTGGLNRQGEIVLVIPRAHELLSLGNTPAYWLRARLLAPLAGQPTYQVSPRIRSVHAEALGGTIAAEHAEIVPAEPIGRSDGVPAQSFTVTHAPVLPRRDGEHIQVIDPDGTTDWNEVSDFTQSGPHDRHFAWDSGSGTVKFGPRVRYADGTVRQHGQIPRDGAQIIVTGYRHGGGARGNVGANTLTVLRSSVPYVRGVTNLAPAAGGVDPETVNEAKTRGPLSLRTGQRAVTVGDYERIARESTTEVARARCLPASNGNGAVRILVVPQVRGHAGQHKLDDFAISNELMGTISSHLDEHRLVGTTMEVSTPYYQGISVAALVHAGQGRPLDLVRQRAIDAITRFINPLTGGTEGTGWPFDADLNAAVITQLLESVDGIERVEEALLFQYDLRKGRRIGTGRDIIRLDSYSLFLSAVPQVVVR
jgi:predicted phage baseplate assembly protein